jgi:hypothetical protein
MSASTCLITCTCMQDVYSEIAKLVQNRVARDEADGVPEAMVLRDNVNRKLVKQTVMTSVYGVTFVGARHQIGNRLKERGWDDERLVYKTSCYGARVSCSSACSRLCLLQSHAGCHKIFGCSNVCRFSENWIHPRSIVVLSFFACLLSPCVYQSHVWCKQT